MKTYSYKDSPLEVHGVPFFEKNGKLERLPEEVRKAVPTLDFMGRRCPGARICFRTNSTKIIVTMELETLHWDSGMPMISAQSITVMIGERKNARFAGLVRPPDYETKFCQGEIEKDSTMEDVTLWLPRNEIVKDIRVSVENDAIVEAPTPYKYPPMLFYGSSITEGGHSCRITNVYSALISQHLDIDYYNLGFSGGAKGEIEMADFINTIPMSIFVYDYDHNAPDVAHLDKTHEKFFLKIREKNPDLPVVMMTKPDFDYDPVAPQRRAIIYKTYQNALARGDKNVYFIDGETFFGDTDRHACTSDRCHPNDLGFYRMALTLEPVIKGILGI